MEGNKKAARILAKKIAAGYNAAGRATSDKALLANLSVLSELLSAESVFMFYGVGDEPDTLPLIKFLLGRGKSVALPRCYPRGRMDAVLINSLDEIKNDGFYGIPEPVGNKILLPENVDVVLAPAAAFDILGNRLGRGGGYYDRWLAASGAKRIGIQRDKLVFDKVPTASYDLPMDMVVTDSKVLRFR